jgi:hypothetical protein
MKEGVHLGKRWWRRRQASEKKVSLSDDTLTLMVTNVENMQTCVMAIMTEWRGSRPSNTVRIKT